MVHVIQVNPPVNRYLKIDFFFCIDFVCFFVFFLLFFIIIFLNNSIISQTRSQSINFHIDIITEAKFRGLIFDIKLTFLPLIKVHTFSGLQARTTLRFVLSTDLDVSDIIYSISIDRQFYLNMAFVVEFIWASSNLHFEILDPIHMCC